MGAGIKIAVFVREPQGLLGCWCESPRPICVSEPGQAIVPVHSLGRHRVEAFSMFSVEVSFKFTLLCIC